MHTIRCTDTHLLFRYNPTEERFERDAASGQFIAAKRFKSIWSTARYEVVE